MHLINVESDMAFNGKKKDGYDARAFLVLVVY
jgi:hypothetical protein